MSCPSAARPEDEGDVVAVRVGHVGHGAPRSLLWSRLESSWQPTHPAHNPMSCPSAARPEDEGDVVAVPVGRHVGHGAPRRSLHEEPT